MAVFVLNLLTLILILIVIWLTRQQRVTTRAGRYNRVFMMTVAVINIALIITEMLIMKNSVLLQAASFICSLLLLISLLVDFKMR